MALLDRWHETGFQGLVHIVAVVNIDAIFPSQSTNHFTFGLWQLFTRHPTLEARIKDTVPVGLRTHPTISMGLCEPYDKRMGTVSGGSGESYQSRVNGNMVMYTRELLSALRARETLLGCLNIKAFGFQLHMSCETQEQREDRRAYPWLWIK